MLLGALGAASAASQDVLMERVLAAVNESPVLLSDVRLLAAVRGLSRDQALEAAIDERLMFQEAARLTQAAVGAPEAQAAYASLAGRATDEERAPLSEAALRRLARIEATILKYVEFRFRPQVRVADDAVRAAYEEETRAASTPPSFEERAPVLREKLEQQALDERLEAWVRELRAAADVRRLPE